MERLTGKKGNHLQYMINVAIILELKNGKIYAGVVDDYHYYRGTGGVVILYGCKLLSKNKREWLDHDRLIRLENGELVPESLSDFWIRDVKNIFVPPEDYQESLYLGDILQIYIDPHYRPLCGIQCDWIDFHDTDRTKINHSSFCDAQLHEALTCLMTEAYRGARALTDDKKGDKINECQEALRYVRRRLLQYGAKIP